MAKRDCKVCNRIILGCDKVFASHVNGKKHQALLPNNITIKGVFDMSHLDAINQYFSTFGTIVFNFHSIRSRFSTVKYKYLNLSSYSTIIQQQPHKVLDIELQLFWKTRTTQVETRVDISNEMESKKRMIIKSLQNATNFDAEARILRNKLQSGCKESEINRNIILSDISQALTQAFNNYDLYFFGSSVTGLDLEGSDLDIYIANVKEADESDVNVLKKIRNMIYKSKKFCDVLLIPACSVPIIKCIHTKTRMCCDLSVKNMLSVYNSQLIKYYTTLDEKLPTFMITVKFWMECCEFKKVNCFSSYAIYMMVIFFLQQEPYNLPTVYDLQDNVEPRIEGGWNCAFDPLPGKYQNEALAKATLLDLFRGFLKFYGDFDFFTYVLCPYIGKQIKRVDFVPPFNWPKLYKQIAAERQIKPSGIIHVQDPFEHNRNVTASITHQTAGRFSITCKLLSIYLNKTKPHFLQNILLDGTGIEKGAFHFFIPKNKSLAIDHEKWIASVKTLLVKVIQSVFKSQTQEIIKNKTQSVFECIGQKSIWTNRSIFEKTLELPPDTDPVDVEIAISNEVIKTYPKAQLITKFILIVNTKENGCEINIKLCGKLIPFIAHYLYVKVPMWVKLMEEKMLDKTQVDMSTPVVKEEIKEDEQKQKVTENTSNSVQATCTEENGDIVIKEEIKEQVALEKEEAQNDATSEKNDEKIEIEEEDKAQDEEDVPADFFDDFANDDFMEGLDIVDAWDDGANKLFEPSMQPVETEIMEETKVDVSETIILKKEEIETQTQKEEKEEGELDDTTTETSSTVTVEPVKVVPEQEEKSKSSKRSSTSSHSSIIKKRKTSPSIVSKKTSVSSSSESDSKKRRNLEKTRRDITKDKIKCAKDKDLKTTSDKLKLVETGLVPPGTELDVDLSSLKKIKEKLSPQRRPYTKDVKVLETRERPRVTRRSRSSSREKRRRYSRSRSPVYRRKYPDNLSTSRSSRRPGRRSRSQERKKEEKKKKSFLEEIRDKLNEIRTPSAPQPTISPAPAPPAIVQYPQLPQYIGAAPVPVPAPAPVPFYHNPMNPGQYDQNFFIGENSYGSAMVAPMHNAMGQNNAMVMAQIPLPPQPANSYPLSQPVAQVPPVPSSVPANLVSVTVKKDGCQIIDKLFADKKISLSDFLTLSAKTEAETPPPDPEDHHKKIRVIYRSQDAIRALSVDDQKTFGRLVVKPSTDTSLPKPSSSKSVDIKHQSPLRRIPVVRFQFTSQAKVVPVELDGGYTSSLEKVLEKIGLKKVLKEINKDTDEVNELERILKNANALKNKQKKIVVIEEEPTLPPQCEECSMRKTKKYEDVGLQCVKETASIGIQVCEEELVPLKPKKPEVVIEVQDDSPVDKKTRAKKMVSPARRYNFDNPVIGHYPSRGRHFGINPHPIRVRPSRREVYPGYFENDPNCFSYNNRY